MYTNFVEGEMSYRVSYLHSYNEKLKTLHHDQRQQEPNLYMNAY